MQGATINVRFTKDHRHKDILHLAGSTMEVSPKEFEKLRRAGAITAVEVAIPRTANIDMEAAKATAQREAETHHPFGTTGRSRFPRGRSTER